MNCATHPNVETNLSCGRCGRPICPRCLVLTPAGQRCRTCARLRRPPMYEVGPLVLARAGLAAIAVGIAGGIAWRLVPQQLLGFFIFLLAAGLGYLMAEAVGQASNRKRGYALQLIAGFGILLAYFIHNFLLVGVLIIPSDLFGILSLVIAVVVAVSPLR